MHIDNNGNNWHIVEKFFDPEQHTTFETLFALGNGYLGLRGSFEEGLREHSSAGTYVNGFYESEPIVYGEKLYGFAENKQTMLNLPNAQGIQLTIDSEPFDLLTGEILDYRRRLDMREGGLHRQVHWRSPLGREIRLDVTRMVCHRHPHLAAIRYVVTPLNFDGQVRLFAGIDAEQKPRNCAEDPRLGHGFSGQVLFAEKGQVQGDVALMLHRTRTTRLQVASGSKTVWGGEGVVAPETGPTSVGHNFTAQGRAGSPITCDKFIAYFTSRETPAAELLSATRTTLDEAAMLGFEALRQEQVAYMADFWSRTDIVIAGDDRLQQGIRFNMFHLLQSTGKDGYTNIAAKGLTGEGYEGHTFWDTEIYILPFFLYNNPHISRKLLEYRYHTLEQARERARQMAHRQGALYPWRTINGEECSPFFPAGTAQYHIDADVAFAIKRYWDATEDATFMRDMGAEILCETARLWYDVGDFIPHKGGKFCINDVTGPDEYTCIVNNNAYTNLMARENLRFAVEMAGWLYTTYPEAYEMLAARLHLDAAEIDDWQRAADAMYVPYDEELGIIPQDDSFLSKARWDFENTPPDKYPLLLHYHPLVIYRYQVCKQADLVLAEFLLHDQFDLAQKRRDYDYYEPLTTHDSSLSACIFGIMAAEVGYHDKAYQYFVDTAITDLEDKKGNTKDGIHAANMAGAWQFIVFGFAGMRAGDGLSFNPTIPEAWTSYAFKIAYRGRLIHVRVDHEGTAFDLLEGVPITIQYQGNPLTLGQDSSEPAVVSASARCCGSANSRCGETSPVSSMPRHT